MNKETIWKLVEGVAILLLLYSLWDKEKRH
jgi:hypothetical protein